MTEIVADNFQVLESRAAREGQSSQTSNGYDNNSSFVGASNSGSFSAPNSQQTPNFGRDESPFGNSNPVDISDDDLPF